MVHGPSQGLYWSSPSPGQDPQGEHVTKPVGGGGAGWRQSGEQGKGPPLHSQAQPVGHTDQGLGIHEVSGLAPFYSEHMAVQGVASVQSQNHRSGLDLNLGLQRPRPVLWFLDISGLRCFW